MDSSSFTKRQANRGTCTWAILAKAHACRCNCCSRLGPTKPRWNWSLRIKAIYKSACTTTRSNFLVIILRLGIQQLYVEKCMHLEHIQDCGSFARKFLFGTSEATKIRLMQERIQTRSTPALTSFSTSPLFFTQNLSTTSCLLFKISSSLKPRT